MLFRAEQNWIFSKENALSFKRKKAAQRKLVFVAVKAANAR